MTAHLSPLHAALYVLLLLLSLLASAEAADDTPPTAAQIAAFPADPSSLASHHLLSYHAHTTLHPNATLTLPFTTSRHSTTLVYVTPWNTDGYKYTLRHHSKVDIVSPVWYTVKFGARESKQVSVDLEGKRNINLEWLADLRQISSDTHRTQIYPRFLLQPAAANDVLLLTSKKSLQKALISVIMDELERVQYDGAVIEATQFWPIVSSTSEAQKHRTALNAFISKLGKRLHTEDKQLCLVVPPHQQNSNAFNADDLQETIKSVDYYSLMTYDYSSGSAKAGPNAPLQWMGAAVKKMGEDMSVEDRRKILMGVNFYGMKWDLMSGAGGPSAIVGHEYLSALQSAALSNSASLTWHPKPIAEHSTTISDAATGSTQTIFYPTPHSLQLRLKLAKQLGVGISVWEGGQGIGVLWDTL